MTTQTPLRRFPRQPRRSMLAARRACPASIPTCEFCSASCRCWRLHYRAPSWRMKYWHNRIVVFVQDLIAPTHARPHRLPDEHGRRRPQSGQLDRLHHIRHAARRVSSPAGQTIAPKSRQNRAAGLSACAGLRPSSAAPSWATARSCWPHLLPGAIRRQRAVGGQLDDHVFAIFGGGYALAYFLRRFWN